MWLNLIFKVLLYLILDGSDDSLDDFLYSRELLNRRELLILQINPCCLQHVHAFLENGMWSQLNAEFLKETLSQDRYEDVLSVRLGLTVDRWGDTKLDGESAFPPDWLLYLFLLFFLPRVLLHDATAPHGIVFHRLLPAELSLGPLEMLVLGGRVIISEDVEIGFKYLLGQFLVPENGLFRELSEFVGHVLLKQVDLLQELEPLGITNVDILKTLDDILSHQADLILQLG